MPTTSTVIDRLLWTLADRTDTDPTELPPLFDAIDPEALASLTAADTPVEITFDYAGHTVTVTDGTIELAPHATPPDATASATRAATQPGGDD